MGEDSAHTWTAYLTGRSALTLRRAYRAREKSVFGRDTVAVLTCGSDPSPSATVFVLSCAALPETGGQDGADQDLRGELDGDSGAAGTGCADVFDMLSRNGVR